TWPRERPSTASGSSTGGTARARPRPSTSTTSATPSPPETPGRRDSACRSDGPQTSRSRALGGDDQRRVAGPVPEQPRRRAGGEQLAGVALVGVEPVAEELWCGERGGVVEGEHAVGVLNQVGTARREDRPRPPEPSTSERVRVPVLRRRRRQAPAC